MPHSVASRGGSSEIAPRPAKHGGAYGISEQAELALVQRQRIPLPSRCVTDRHGEAGKKIRRHRKRWREPMTEESMSPGDVAPEGTPGTGENICETCRGTGRIDGEICDRCGGIGKVIEGIGGA